MDVQMPELSGIETTRKLRERAANLAKRPWIIALTASAMPEDREQCSPPAWTITSASRSSSRNSQAPSPGPGSERPDTGGITLGRKLVASRRKMTPTEPRKTG